MYFPFLPVIFAVEPLITFIIPSVNRPTLGRTLESLMRMQNPNWRAIVMFDGFDVPPMESRDPRIKMSSMVKTGTSNHGGRVRNQAIKEAVTEWIGFVDDDDTLEPTYVDHLHQHLAENNYDVVIFRMKDERNESSTLILPPMDHTDFVINRVGISFAMKRTLMTEENFWFEPSSAEDFYLLDRLRTAGKTIVLSPFVEYNVRPTVIDIQDPPHDVDVAVLPTSFSPSTSWLIALLLLPFNSLLLL